MAINFSWKTAFIANVQRRNASASVRGSSAANTHPSVSCEGMPSRRSKNFRQPVTLSLGETLDADETIGTAVHREQ
jgi:hypothetical protein